MVNIKLAWNFVLRTATFVVLIGVALIGVSLSANAEQANWWDESKMSWAEFSRTYADKAVNEKGRYEFAWMSFIRASQPLSYDPRAAAFETWATNDDTFPNSGTTPVWPSAIAQIRSGETSPAPHLPANVDIPGEISDLKDSSAGGFKYVLGGTYRNRESFGYIVDNNLWNKQGVKKAQMSRNTDVSFPVGAVEYKTNWAPIKESQKNQFHWNYFVPDEGKEQILVGLISINFFVKVTSNWFFISIEHKDNPYRGYPYGATDEFGSNPGIVSNVSSAIGQLDIRWNQWWESLKSQLKQQQPTAQLRALMNEAGMRDVWLNYRLGGVQLDFTDSYGNPTFLGSSISEWGFLSSSSCITCHGNASLNSDLEGPFFFNLSAKPIYPDRVISPSGPLSKDLLGLGQYKTFDFNWSIVSNAVDIDESEQ